MVLNLHDGPELPPIFRHGPDTMWADRDDLLNSCLRKRLQVRFGELAEYQVIAQAARWSAGTTFFFEHSKARTEVLHYRSESGNNLAAPRIVRSHAAQPQAVFLTAVESGKLLLGDELVAFALRETHGVAIAFQVEKEFGASRFQDRIR